MEELVNEAKLDHRIREKAIQLTNHLRGRDWVGEVQAIFEYVRDRIRYVPDPVDLETITQPSKTIELGAGDCDDKAILAAALLQAIGHPVMFEAVGFNGEPISHVYVSTLIGPNWVPLETTECSMELGQYPDGITSRMTHYLSRPVKRRRW